MKTEEIFTNLNIGDLVEIEYRTSIFTSNVAKRTGYISMFNEYSLRLTSNNPLDAGSKPLFDVNRKIKYGMMLNYTKYVKESKEEK